MQVVICASEKQKEELLSDTTIQEGTSLIWISDINEIAQYNDSDVLIDLLFENTPKHLEQLSPFLNRLIIINSVTDTLEEINSSFIRINGWITFLKGNIIEASYLDQEKKLEAEKVFALFGKSIEWLRDLPGFVTPRVISMIINEAFFALKEGVSTPEEINTAMKLGTAYPFGPFEWGAKIGLQNVVALLQKLAKQQARYTPSSLLVQESNR
jgi:3-hydroxybutyryl-CoA dehydrogenase